MTNEDLAFFSTHACLVSLGFVLICKSTQDHDWPSCGQVTAPGEPLSQRRVCVAAWQAPPRDLHPSFGLHLAWVFTCRVCRGIPSGHGTTHDRCPTGARPVPDRCPTGARPVPDRCKGPTGARPVPDRCPTGARPVPDRCPTGADRCPTGARPVPDRCGDRWQVRCSTCLSTPRPCVGIRTMAQCTGGLTSLPRTPPRQQAHYHITNCIWTVPSPPIDRISPRPTP